MIPDFQTLMLPFLRHIADGKEHSLQETYLGLAQLYKLTDEELAQVLPSGRQRVFYNRVGWARTYLNQAEFLQYTKRGHFKITETGNKTLSLKPEKIDLKYLRQIPAYVKNSSAEKQEKANVVAKPEDETEPSVTPEETMASNYLAIRKNLGNELLSRILDSSPAFFEKLVVELLVKMGYGGTFEEAGKAIGRSGDEGIDGIIKEDRLGLDLIYVQAKRWNKEAPVGRSAIQAFVGALAGQGARKGVFITTSKFSKDAKEYQPKNETKIVLIDGEQLANLMMDHDLAVATTHTFTIKRIDNDYFDEA